MKINRLLFIIVCLGLLALSSCHKDPPQVSPAQAKSSLTATNQDLSSEVSSLSLTSGYAALKSFSSLTNTSSPFGRVKSFGWLGARSQFHAGTIAIRKMIFTASANERVQGDQPFDYASKKGVYAWDPNKNSWTKTGSSDIIKIQYPTQGSATNNAEFWLTSYTEISTPNGAEAYSPTNVQASTYVDGTKQSELKLNVAYGSDDQPETESLDLFINPYTISFSFDNAKSNSISLSFSFSKSGKALISTSLTASYPAGASKLSGDPPTGLTGFVQLMTVRFNITIDGNKAATSSDLNDFIHIAVIINGASAGNVVFVTDNQTGEQKAFIQYIDNTRQSLDDLFTDLSTQLKAIVF